MSEVHGATVETPWGDASELRSRKLRPRAGTPPEEVARNQRERLFAAIIALASQKGYEAMTVADVVALSGVSRSAFYEHFANKSECLTAAALELVESTLAALGPGRSKTAARRQGERDLRGVLRRSLRSQPAAARVCFVELHVAGEAGEAIGRPRPRGAGLYGRSARRRAAGRPADGPRAGAGADRRDCAS